MLHIRNTARGLHIMYLENLNPFTLIISFSAAASSQVIRGSLMEGWGALLQEHSIEQRRVGPAPYTSDDLGADHSLSLAELPPLGYHS